MRTFLHHRTLFLVATGSLIGLLYLAYYLKHSFLPLPKDELYSEISGSFFQAQPAAVRLSLDGTKVLTKEQLSEGFQVTAHDVQTSRAIAQSFSINSQRSLTWNPDGATIAFQEIDGKKRPLFVFDLETARKQRIDVDPSETALPPLRWNPVGSRLAYFCGGVSTGDLLILDFGQKQVRRSIAKKRMSATCDFVWSPNGSHIAIATASDPGVITIFHVDSQKTSKLMIGSRSRVDGLAWNPTGESILATARGEPDEYFKLYELRLSVHDGTYDAEASVKAEVEGDISSPLWMPDGRSYIYHVLSDGIVTPFFTQEKGIARPIGPTNGVTHITHSSKDGQKLFARHASLSHPPALIEISVSTGAERTLYAPPSSGAVSCPIPKSIRVMSHDGSLIPAYHWSAEESASPPKGVVIEVHGGLHTQTFPTWENYIHVLTKHGCDVIAVNYRGSSGFGRSFERSGNNYDRIMDVVAARNYAVNELKTAPEKIVIMGNSRGASLAAGACVQGFPVGGVALISWAGAPSEKAPTPADLRIMGFHGDMDPFVSPQQARDSVARFFSQSAGHQVKTRWHRFPSEGHFFYNAESWSTVCWEIINSVGLGAKPD